MYMYHIESFYIVAVSSVHSAFLSGLWLEGLQQPTDGHGFPISFVLPLPPPP